MQAQLHPPRGGCQNQFAAAASSAQAMVTQSKALQACFILSNLACTVPMADQEGAEGSTPKLQQLVIDVSDCEVSTSSHHLSQLTR